MKSSLSTRAITPASFPPLIHQPAIELLFALLAVDFVCAPDKRNWERAEPEEDVGRIVSQPAKKSTYWLLESFFVPSPEDELF